MNKKVLFNDGWEFAKSSLEVTDSSSLTFEQVDIPHDWLIYNSLDLYENSIGWYRKQFIYNKQEKQILLYFEGVYMDSSLYVNGRFIGEWKYGYSSFEYDITEALLEGKNEILVKVVYQSPNSRWYSGAGIYRNVWLKTRDKNHIVTDGIYVSINQKDNGWQVEVDSELSIYEEAEITHTITYKDEIIAFASERVHQEKVANRHNLQKLFVKNPMLWSTEKPNLYKLITDLYVIDENESKFKIESVTQNIGFREIILDPNEGLKLNGKRLKINGVCEHHDLGALGSAFNKAALKRRFKLLKEMGVNAIRTSHNMPAPELMELADEMGMLIDSEAFDMWERSKTPYDYGRFFNEWAHSDVKSWIMRDRNHPSLLMWSIGNEIYDTHAGERGQQITRILMDYVREFDPKENAKITIGSNYMPWENAQKCADIVKVAGYNYAEKYYQKHHEEHPDWIIYGSETSSIVQSRGIYHFPFEKSILADDDEQCSALGNSTTSWGAKSAEACILAERDTHFSLGQFLWTGFDYIGEPTPYHTKNSYFGQIDTATFKKDSYYIYQAEWTDYKSKPMVHIFPYWDFNKGQTIDVRVCSNAPKIELQFNGKTVGTYDIDHEHGIQLVGCWKIPYEEGELKAIAYDKSGRIIAEDIKRSFGDAKKIKLNPDKEIIAADGTDLIFVEITMEDEKGNAVENANNRVNVNVTGAGRLLGLDNGDSTDYDQYKGLSRRLFSGKLMAIIGSTLELGIIRLEVSSEGLDSKSIEFEALPAADKELTGISANMENKAMLCVMGNIDEIPLRKIEIISNSGQTFDETRKDIIVTAQLYPENTSFKEVEWSVVNDVGIPSNIAKVEANGLEAKVTAFGDGEFRIRCTSKNGTHKTKLISELELRAIGLGLAYKDPYGFISAGLYDYSKGEVTNGNERGVATSRDGETQVGFHGIDFGNYGSDTITIPIFALSDEEYPIEIWKGMPEEEGSELLANVIYQKESKWNVYQEQTYKLPKKLKGITSVCFVLRQKVHIKGFTFEKINRTFEKNYASECDSIYGDTYTKTEKNVEGIGNNVSLVFEDMDFTKEGVSKLVICGKSPIDKNTIHVRFANAEGESNQMVEFTKTDAYEERIFNINKITGMQKVTFIFLPGSNFDFSWFRFER
ncbi:glycoside hydrolase family 2 TIM barrel-domain containing protein [Clostridium oryzae]|uniref:Beta-galactosidase BoGH2A n=1 Tax=Clostridium oryzae TaxID=1450648 RepID=A0A1V4IIF1_9CLOT|nr:glycoside hydrolase family 2 TIM barrel-domain containing protein [Clostridium oryzae]OPJ59277.1 beta-galactosidase BoGH2A precursor [Clostridium oryzae]